MTFGELLDEERREGRAEGRAEGRVEGRAEGRIEGHAEGRIDGQNYVFALINAMAADGRGAEVPRLAEDETFREEMFARYHIMDDIREVQNA